MKKVFPLIMFLCFTSCMSNLYDKEIILVSIKSEPTNFSHLMIFEDSTFEYVSKGIKNENVFKGKALINSDTIYLTYNDTIPNVGEKVFYTKDFIEFIEANNVRLENKFNKLK